jgi:hypothetical protein
MRTPDKIQEACDRLGTRGPPGILEVYGPCQTKKKTAVTSGLSGSIPLSRIAIPPWASGLNGLRRPSGSGLSDLLPPLAPKLASTDTGGEFLGIFANPSRSSALVESFG